MFRKKSKVWQHFSRKSKEEAEAECSICNKIIKSVGGSTSGLKAHAIKVHAINFEDDSSGPLCKKQRTLEHLIERKSVDGVIAKLACKDGLSFRQIAVSEFIQSNLMKVLGKTLNCNWFGIHLKYPPARVMAAVADGAAGG